MSAVKKSIVLCTLLAVSAFAGQNFFKKRTEYTNVLKESVNLDQETLRQVSVGVILTEFKTANKISNDNPDNVLDLIIKHDGLIAMPKTTLGNLEFYGESTDSANEAVKFVGYKVAKKTTCELIQKDKAVSTYNSITLASSSEALDSLGNNRIFCYQSLSGDYTAAYRVEGAGLGK